MVHEWQVPIAIESLDIERDLARVMALDFGGHARTDN
jgi:hypothetical protein